MRRGEVWWANLPPPAGRRPVVLLSRDESYEIRSLVLVSPVTTNIRGLAVEVGLGPEDGLARRCVVNLDVINVVPKRLIELRIGPLDADKLAAVDAAIHYALGLRD